ncbi:hypothetical protein PR048_001031 [Dryococelus australis]|uniref:Myb/SANT-like DNA-binding domain-containing protein n=1 Tax=Dryococelus australis TaxID=614101 RepID=A0ABQ9IG88_9NEOP|nr:hypothetical protein PR048_001031 [Dryococelus australis]
MLIQVRTEKQSLFTGKKGSAQTGWKRVTEQIGIGATPKQCKRKWENMVQRYKDIVTPPAGISTEDKPPATDWVHFNAMHEFMGMRYTVNPSFIVDTGAETTVIEPEIMHMQVLTPPSPACSLTIPETCDEAPIPLPPGIVDMPLPQLPFLQGSKRNADSMNYPSTSAKGLTDMRNRKKSKNMKKTNISMTIDDLAKILQEQERAAAERHREFMDLLQMLLNSKRNDAS